MGCWLWTSACWQRAPQRRLRWCRWGGRRWARGQPRSSCSTSPAWPGCVCRRCTCAGWRCEAGSRRQKRGVGVGDLTRSDPVPRHGQRQHRRPENASRRRVPFAVITSICEPNQCFVTHWCYFFRLMAEWIPGQAGGILRPNTGSSWIPVSWMNLKRCPKRGWQDRTPGCLSFPRVLWPPAHLHLSGLGTDWLLPQKIHCKGWCSWAAFTAPQQPWEVRQLSRASPSFQAQLLKGSKPRRAPSINFSSIFGEILGKASSLGWTAV